MRKRRILAFLAGALGIGLLIGMIVPTTANAESASKYYCNLVTGGKTDYNCFLPAGQISSLSNGPTDVLDDANGKTHNVASATQPAYTTDPNGEHVATVSWYGDTDNNSGAYISIDKTTKRDFSFTLTLDNGVTEIISVSVDPFVAPVAPTVTKSKVIGYIVVTLPKSGQAEYFSYGSFNNANPDGTITIAPGHAYRVKVKRSNVDWEAIRKSDGQLVATGTVKGVKLK